MKKTVALLLVLVMALGLMAGCGNETPAEQPAAASEAPAEPPAGEAGNIRIDTLRIAFVPSREPDEIITITEPLKQLLKDELAKQGYDVGEVDTPPLPTGVSSLPIF